MTDSKKDGENQELFIPRIEKPIIRIEADKELYIMNDYILKQVGRLHVRDFEMDFKDALKDLSEDLKERFREVFKEHYEQDNQEPLVKDVYNHPKGFLPEGFLPEGEEFKSLGELKKEYLQLKGFEFATPGFGIIPSFDGDYQSTYVEGVVLTYCSERDLTLSQLNELLTIIWEKLQSIVADIGLDMDIIRKITVQGYREPGVVFDVLDDLIDYIEYFGLHTSNREDAITHELELIGVTDKTDWFLAAVIAKYGSENVWDILDLLAEKLDKFRNLLMGKNRRF